MRKKFTMLLALVLCVLSSSVMAQTAYKVGARTTTLEAGKQYYISAATYYRNARPNLLYNNNGDLAYSNVKPSGKVANAAYLFEVEEVGENNTYYIKNSDGKYLQSGKLASTEGKTAITVVPYANVKGGISCGSDVDACDETGARILYNDITAETPVVCVYQDANAGWRHIEGLEIGKSTPFAFYEVEEVSLLPELTTDTKNPILYTIKNIRGNAYASYNGKVTAMKLSSAVSGNEYLFYFTKGSKENTYKIHNYYNGLLCTSYNSWNEEGIDWYIQMSENKDYPGLAISKDKTLTQDGEEAWNDYQNKHTSVNWYGGNDAGSTWEISRHEGETFNVKLSTAEAKYFYSIKNVRSGKFANYVSDNTAFTQVDAVGYGSYWYFVDATADLPEGTEIPNGAVACRIYNAANEFAVENPQAGLMTPNSGVDYPAKIYYLMPFEKGSRWGYVIYPYNETDAGWNDKTSSSVCNYDYDDEGSVWYFASINKTEAQLITEVATAKNNALNAIAAYEYADYYTYTDEAIATAKAAVNAVNADNLVSAVNELMTNTIENAMNALATTEKGNVAPVAGQYIQLKNRQYSKYLKDNGTKLNSVESATDLTTLWFVETGSGTNVKLKNVSTGKYIGQIRQSEDVAMVEATAAKEFAFTNQNDVYAVFKETTGGNYAYGHIAGHNVLVGWEAGSNATQWLVAQISAEPYVQALQEAIDQVNTALLGANVGTEVGQYTVTNEAFLTAMVEAQTLIDNKSTDIKALYDAKQGLSGYNVATLEKSFNVPEEGKYYVIECPLFYNVQGVKKALFSNGSQIRWATLDRCDKKFYWTVEKTETGYVLKNYNDDKYVLGKNANNTSWTMEEATTGAEYTIEAAREGQVFIKIAGRHLHANNHGGGSGSGGDIVSWETGSANTASAWKFFYVKNPDLEMAKVSLQNKIDELELIIDNRGKVGYYSASETDKLVEPVKAAAAVLDEGSSEPSVYSTALETLNTAISDVDKTIVLPQDGGFYRIKNYGGTGYLSSGISGRAQFAANEGVSVIFCYTDGKLLSYKEGESFGKDSNNKLIYSPSLENATAIVFEASRIVGKLQIKFGGNRYLFSERVGDSDSGDANAANIIPEGRNANYLFTVEEVEPTTVTIGNLGYSTLYSEVALSIPEGVTAYTGTLNETAEDITLTLHEVNNEGRIIPANTAVILNAAANDYDFNIAEKVDAIDNDLRGTATEISTSSVTDGVVYTLQPYTGDDDTYKLPVVFMQYADENKPEEALVLKAGKAYLVLPEGQKSISIRFEGTTDIEHSEIRNQHSEMIFDLLGRRVEAITKGGIYIVNGKKVVVK